MPEADRQGTADGAARLAQAVAAIDAANAEDPNRVVVDGVPRPKEVVHADVVERWLRRLVDEPDDVQLLAARAHHLRRWVVPRASYPEGRAGYLRWRADQKRRHAAEVAEILTEAGYDDATTAAVADVVAKRGLGTDRRVQAHEDALCLAFLELQAAEVAGQLGVDHAVEVLRKTARKMSPQGLALVAEVPVPPEVRDLLARALDVGEAT